MEKNIHQLYTKLSVDECLSRLRGQVQPMRFLFWSRVTFFPKRASKVMGRVSDKEFILEATNDPFSKRMKGRLVERPSGTAIEYEWKVPFWSRLSGSSK